MLAAPFNNTFIDLVWRRCPIYFAVNRYLPRDFETQRFQNFAKFWTIADQAKRILNVLGKKLVLDNTCPPKMGRQVGRLKLLLDVYRVTATQQLATFASIVALALLLPGAKVQLEVIR